MVLQVSIASNLPGGSSASTGDYTTGYAYYNSYSAYANYAYTH